LVLLAIHTFNPAESEIIVIVYAAQYAAWRFDWPAFLRHSETGQTNRRNANLDGRALNRRSKTALNSAVVRLCHSRPAPFRCRFQNARSVLGPHEPQSVTAIVHQTRDAHLRAFRFANYHVNHGANYAINFRASSDASCGVNCMYTSLPIIVPPAITQVHANSSAHTILCGFESGRLTPWIFKVLLSAKWSQFKREISAPLSGLLAVALSSPHPQTRSVRDRSQSATTTAVCPCPRTIHVHDLSVNISVSTHCPQSRSVHRRELSTSAHSPWPRTGRVESDSGIWHCPQALSEPATDYPRP